MHTPYTQMSPDARRAEYAALQARFAELKDQGLKLDMTRGKPCREQLDMVSGLLSALTEPEDCVSDGIDTRNYGALDGLPAAKRYFAEILGCRPEQVFAGGNSSLQLMYTVIDFAFIHGRRNSPRPWCKEPVVKWLCPSPGYDRHFRVTESFGFELVTIPMTADGPDMDAVEEAVKDPAVKGIWCVPKYANPDGIIYSSETLARLAALEPAAPDFTIMWDNAYCIHTFDGPCGEFPDLLTLCIQAGHPDLVYEFFSTSKITYPGAGISCLACSEENLAEYMKWAGVQTITYDKVNQLRHIRYLQDKAHTMEILQSHARFMGPKFQAVQDALEREIAPLEIADWSHPKGGYFVSFYAMPGTAKRTLALCQEAGVVMTAAGATYPYGVDPQDSNLRIAPSLPPLAEVEKAMDVFCVCLRMAALEKLGL